MYGGEQRSNNDQPISQMELPSLDIGTIRYKPARPNNVANIASKEGRFPINGPVSNNTQMTLSPARKPVFEAVVN